MRISRRRFIQSTAAAAASTAVPLETAAQNIVTDAEAAKLTWSKAPCRFCGVGCGVQVGVRDNRVVATQADAQAEVNRGVNCVKGYYLSKIMYGAYRLTTPLLRMRNGRYDKNGEFTPVSWDRAFGSMLFVRKPAFINLSAAYPSQIVHWPEPNIPTAVGPFSLSTRFHCVAISSNARSHDTGVNSPFLS